MYPGRAFITDKCSDPVAAIRLLDMFYATEEDAVEGFSGLTTFVGWEGEHWEYTDDTKTAYSWIDPITGFSDINKTVSVNMELPGLLEFNAMPAGSPLMEMKCEQVAEMQAPYYNIKNAYPQNARFTAEESERGNVIENDLYTQVLMMTTKFIVGDTDIESGWEDYLASLEKIGLAELTEIKEAALAAERSHPISFVRTGRGLPKGEQPPAFFKGQWQRKRENHNDPYGGDRGAPAGAARSYTACGRRGPGAGPPCTRRRQLAVPLGPQQHSRAKRRHGACTRGMPAAGRWLLCHSGTVDARCFGVFGPDVPADDALDALMADGSVTRIVFGTGCEFHTPPHVHTRARHAGFHRPHSNGTGRGARKAQRSLRRAVSLYGRAGG